MKRGYLSYFSVWMVILLMIVLSVPAPARLEGSDLRAELTLDRYDIIGGQRITATLDINGGTPPYTVNYEWLVYSSDATYTSRPVYTDNGSTTSNSFSTIVDAEEGDGQLDAQITDSAGSTTYASASFGVYEFFDHPEAFNSELLQGKWVLHDDNAMNEFSLILNSDGHVRVESSHPFWAHGYQELTGKVSFDEGYLLIRADTGEEVGYYYFLSMNDGKPVLQLEMPNASVLDLEYDPEYVSAPFEKMAKDQIKPAEINGYHQKLLGQWEGIGEHDKETRFFLELTADGRFRYEQQALDSKALIVKLGGTVTDVGHESISYVSDEGFAGYFLYWFRDGTTLLELMYQDYTGLLEKKN